MISQHTCRAAAVLCALFLAGCASSPTPKTAPAYPEPMARFAAGSTACHVRTRQDVAVVDTHLHMRPMGGAPLPFAEMVSNLKSSGIVFANIYGIGQKVATDSDCEYYLDCPGTPVLPSLKSDFANAQDLLEARPEGIVLTLAMTFPDLAHPEGIPEKMDLLEAEYPGMFRWMGEVNVVKKALEPNGHTTPTVDAIRAWAPFMKILRERNMPLALHLDLGDNSAPTKNLPLLEEIVRLYPDNKIVWVHMGLSRELTMIDPLEHTALLSRLLRDRPNLYLDLSWRVLYDAYFSKPKARRAYVALIDYNPTRFLPGTDFVAGHAKTRDDYVQELSLTSDILHDVSDAAFRDIALGQNYFDLMRMTWQAPRICGNSFPSDP